MGSVPSRVVLCCCFPMTLQNWETRLSRFMAATDRDVLQDAGKVTAEIAKAHAETESENTASRRTGCVRASLTGC